MSSTAVPGPVGRPRGRRLSSVFRRQGVQAFLFISPAILLLAVLIVYPMVRTSIYSFANLNSRLEVTRWIGFDNYTRLFTKDKSFLNLDEFPPSGALVNNVKWMILYTSLSLLLGLLIAVLAARVRYESLMKAIVFVPMAIAATAVAIIWKFVYEPDPNLGSLNAFTTMLGADPIAWYGRADTVNYALIFAYVWASTGFAMVVLSAALKGISEEVIEAARTDGANEWDIFRRIQLPLLSLPIAVVTVWLLVNVIKVFDLIYVMTGGGPGGASEVIAVTMVDEFGNGEGGYSAAIAVVMLLLIIPIMVFNIRRFRSERVTG
ncbi:MAG TPA: sugar ABC transporter permease [Gaiellaceae bacterium]|jgi:alpha-glucoside transport system permease protein|nr:sugar ABC transporter permease [Gaiellaceae bacterium]